MKVMTTNDGKRCPLSVKRQLRTPFSEERDGRSEEQEGVEDENQEPQSTHLVADDGAEAGEKQRRRLELLYLCLCFFKANKRRWLPPQEYPHSSPSLCASL